MLTTEQFAYLYRSGDKGIAFIENEGNEMDIVRQSSHSQHVFPLWLIQAVEWRSIILGK